MHRRFPQVFRKNVSLVIPMLSKSCIVINKIEMKKNIGTEWSNKPFVSISVTACMTFWIFTQVINYDNKIVLGDFNQKPENPAMVTLLNDYCFCV